MLLTSLSALSRRVKPLYLLVLAVLMGSPLLAQGEAELKLPDLSAALFQGVNGRTLLMAGIGVSVLGLIFGLMMYRHLRNLPVHESMLEISELIYETCKTYLLTQGKFLLILEIFIGAIIVLYFGVISGMATFQVAIILAFSLVGIAGSYGVAWFGIRVNTFANSRTAFASLRGKPFPCYAIPLKAGMSIGMMLISVELLIMLCILLFIPGEYAGPCFIGFAIGESLGAAALRVAGGIFTKIADIGADLMKIVFKIKEDDARNPGVIADCTGDNAGDSVGPSADGFETYGVTGVALINFIILAVNNDITKVELLVWIFSMRVMMIIASALSYFLNEAVAKAKYQNVDKMNYEAPLTSLVWLTSFISIGATYALSYFMIPDLGGDSSMWWKLSTIITCGTLAGAIIPELVKVFTSVESAHVKEVVTSSREGGASLNILSGLWRETLAHSGWDDHDGADGHRILRERIRHGGADAGSRGVRIRVGGVRISGNGPGNDRGGLVRPGDRQRAVGVRAEPDRDRSEHQEQPEDQVRVRRRFRKGQASSRRKRRRWQHIQGHREARADRYGRGGIDHHDILDHHFIDRASEAGVAC
jgi:K(+)-stimulated pyrophosphate-energized sodium pump